VAESATDKTGWYPHGWAYRDLYGIPVSSSMARRHPSWILRDGHGRRLYLQYACDGRRCAQYAADVRAAGFRHQWITAARHDLAHGYAGLWIDDVNLELRTSDGAGTAVRPVRRGRRMSDRSWRSGIAEFTEEIRRALPTTEIVHNSIWFAGGTRRQADPSVRREIRAADVVNLERGVNDDGLTGDDGPWSVQALLRFVDDVHALGRSVIFEGIDPSSQAREYNLAAEMLASDGGDSVGVTELAPGASWDVSKLDLGAADGARSSQDGVIQRRFASGLVLLNPPGGRVTSVSIDGDYVDLRGQRVQRVTLSPKSGAVLRSR
jgi:hypothetical protein